MVVFPNAKINLGLQVVLKREDGFHNLQTMFYPVDLCDKLEILVDESIDGIEISTSGMSVGCSPEQNLIYKAWALLNENHNLPGINVHLNKVIPSEAGLGGGSSDGSFMLLALNKLFMLGYSTNELADMSLKLGSDCPFFIYNQPAFASGRGEDLSLVDPFLTESFIYIVKPPVSISTGKAFAGITPVASKFDLNKLPKTMRVDWPTMVENDFEKSLFPQFPELAEIKQTLYNMGAFYASLSGSGSALYGLFDHEVNFNKEFSNYFNWRGIIKV